jgi:hypothetical protein
VFGHVDKEAARARDRKVTEWCMECLQLESALLEFVKKRFSDVEILAKMLLAMYLHWSANEASFVWKHVACRIAMTLAASTRAWRIIHMHDESALTMERELTKELR